MININHIENIFGIIALITSIIGLLPQVYKAHQSRSTQDISMIMLVNYALCSGAWIVHGLCQQSTFVVISNVVGLIISSISIAQKRHYDAQLA